MDKFTEDFAKSAGKELAKQASKPILDVVRPTAREVGKIFALPFKFINSVAFYLPKKAVIHFETKIKQYEKMQSDKLAQIPEEFRVNPPLNILAPAIEGVALNLDNDILKELFSNLIKNSCDSRTQKRAHPLFVEILKSMSSLDALLFETLANKNNLLFGDTLPAINPKASVFENGQNKSFLLSMLPDYFLGVEIEGYDYFEISESFHRILSWGLFEDKNNLLLAECKKLSENKFLNEKTEFLNKTNKNHNIRLTYVSKGFAMTENGKAFAKTVLNLEKWHPFDFNKIMDAARNGEVNKMLDVILETSTECQDIARFRHALTKQQTRTETKN